MSEMKQLAPGVYEVGRELHIDAPEVCAAFGCPPTSKNIEIVVAAVREVFGSEGVPIEVEEGD